MNPSFRPPPPVSNKLKDHLYNEFLKNPKANSVRKLSQEYHISLKRIDAILRLKGLEKAWIRVRVDLSFPSSSSYPMLLHDDFSNRLVFKTPHGYTFSLFY